MKWSDSLQFLILTNRECNKGLEGISDLVFSFILPSLRSSARSLVGGWTGENSPTCISIAGHLGSTPRRFCVNRGTSRHLPLLPQPNQHALDYLVQHPHNASRKTSSSSRASFCGVHRYTSVIRSWRPNVSCFSSGRFHSSSNGSQVSRSAAKRRCPFISRRPP